MNGLALGPANAEGLDFAATPKPKLSFCQVVPVQWDRRSDPLLSTHAMNCVPLGPRYALGLVPARIASPKLSFCQAEPVQCDRRSDPVPSAQAMNWKVPLG